MRPCRSVLGNKSSLRSPRVAAKLAQQADRAVGAGAVRGNIDGTCARLLNVRRAPGQTPTM